METIFFVYDIYSFPCNIQYAKFYENGSSKKFQINNFNLYNIYEFSLFHFENKIINQFIIQSINNKVL